MEVRDGDLAMGRGSLCAPPTAQQDCAVPPRYDLQIRYLPEDYMERFLEDKTTLLYFYQQVLQSPLPTPGIAELHLSPSPAHRKGGSQSACTPVSTPTP